MNLRLKVEFVSCNAIYFDIKRSVNSRLSLLKLYLALIPKIPTSHSSLPFITRVLVHLHSKVLKSRH